MAAAVALRPDGLDNIVDPPRQRVAALQGVPIHPRSGSRAAATHGRAAREAVAAIRARSKAATTALAPAASWPTKQR